MGPAHAPAQSGRRSAGTGEGGAFKGRFLILWRYFASPSRSRSRLCSFIYPTPGPAPRRGGESEFLGIYSGTKCRNKSPFPFSPPSRCRKGAGGMGKRWQTVRKISVEKLLEKVPLKNSIHGLRNVPLKGREEGVLCGTHGHGRPIKISAAIARPFPYILSCGESTRRIALW
jgi:hypothetical protein